MAILYSIILIAAAIFQLVLTAPIGPDAGGALNGTWPDPIAVAKMCVLPESFEKKEASGRMFDDNPDKATTIISCVMDILIALAYFSIPLELLYYLRHVKSPFPFPSILLMFCCFICLCGVTHLVNSWQAFYLTQALSAFVKFATAVISVYTAVVLGQILPAALRLPLYASKLELTLIEQKLATKLLRRENQIMSSFRQLTQQIRRFLDHEKILLTATEEIATACDATACVVIRLWRENLICEQAYFSNQATGGGDTTPTMTFSDESYLSLDLATNSPYLSSENYAFVNKPLSIAPSDIATYFKTDRATDIDLSNSCSTLFGDLLDPDSFAIVLPFTAPMATQCWLMTTFPKARFAAPNDEFLRSKPEEISSGRSGEKWYNRFVPQLMSTTFGSKYSALGNDSEANVSSDYSAEHSDSRRSSDTGILKLRASGTLSPLALEGDALSKTMFSRAQVDGLLPLVCEQITIALEQSWLIEQQKQKSDELAKQNDLLDKARRESQMVTAQKEFLAIMSHELRTPLFACSSMSQLLMECSLITRYADTSEGLEALNLIEVLKKSNDMLVDIVNNVLDFSKYESIGFQLERRPFSLRNTVESAAEIVCMQDHTNRFPQVVYFVDKDVPEKVIGDEVRVRQILTNLLSNACKFTPAEGYVSCTVELAPPSELAVCTNASSEQDEAENPASAQRLRSSQEDTFSSNPSQEASNTDAAAYSEGSQKLGHDGIERLQITVKDTGIGVDEKQRTKLFGKFQQLDSSITRKHGGTGLGLAITKQLALLMNGSVVVRSNTEAPSGTSFAVTIELDKVARAAPAGRQKPKSSFSSVFRVGVLEPHEQVRRHLESQFAALGLAPEFTWCSTIEDLRNLTNSGKFDSVIFDLSWYCGASGAATAKSHSSVLTVSSSSSELEDGSDSPISNIFPQLTSENFEMLCETAAHLQPGMFCVLCPSLMLAHARHALQSLNPVILIKPVKSIGLKRLFRLFKKLAGQKDVSSARLRQSSSLSAGQSPILASPQTMGEIEHASAFAVSDKLDVRPLQPSSGMSSPSTPGLQMPSLSGMLGQRVIPADFRILLVEDNPVIQTVLMKILTRLNIACEVAVDGIDALNKFTRRDMYDFVFMDHMMPRMDGIEATKILRKRFPPLCVDKTTGQVVDYQPDDSVPKSPASRDGDSDFGQESHENEEQHRNTMLVYKPWICALTANVLATYQIEYVSAGMNDCLIKPAAISDIANAISKYLDSDSSKKFPS